MASRTPEGKHTPRFIVQYKSELDKTTYRSGNSGLSGHFPTRELAQAAIKEFGSEGINYTVRQK